MADLLFSWELIKGGILVIVCWELAKYAFQALSGTRKPVAAGSAAEQRLNFERKPSYDFDNLEMPDEPHVEIALDPPCGLHLSNPKEAYKFENDFCTGTYLFFHPPAMDGSSEGPNGMDYNEYFIGKSRLWEIRLQLRFKKAPTPDMDLFFGVELDEYVPLSMASRQSQNLVTAALRQAVGGVYQSPGDNPAKVDGEREPPVCVLPLWAFDQFIITPEGGKPPNLADPEFSNLGTKRYKRVAEYKKEMESLQRDLTVGTTYTLAFWGVSRFLDVINWMVIGIPVATPIDFNKFAGRPPVGVVLYGMKQGEGQQSNDKRHLRSKKSYYWRASIWSSGKRPERSRVEALTGLIGEGKAFGLKKPVITEQKSLRRRFTSYLKHSIAEPIAMSCVSRD